MSLPRNAWRRWRVRMGYPVGLMYWLLAAPSGGAILIGAIVAGFGLTVRGAASGQLRKDEELTTTGLYARTRNPLYLGSAFLAAGFVIAGRSWMAGLIVAAYFAIFYSAAIRNEQEYLRERFGAAFDDYAAHVPAFFPWFANAAGKPSDPAVAFSSARYRRNREYQALFGTVAGFGLVWLRMWLRARLGH